MCTTISETAAINGSGKGPTGWFQLAHAQVGYDHPFHAPLEHAVLVDLVDESAGTRLAVELTRESARELALRILATVDQADVYEQAEGSER